MEGLETKEMIVLFGFIAGLIGMIIKVTFRSKNLREDLLNDLQIFEQIKNESYKKKIEFHLEYLIDRIYGYEPLGDDKASEAMMVGLLFAIAAVALFYFLNPGWFRWTTAGSRAFLAIMAFVAARTFMKVAEKYQIKFRKMFEKKDSEGSKSNQEQS